MGEVTAIDATTRRLDVRCPDGARGRSATTADPRGRDEDVLLRQRRVRALAPGMKTIEEAMALARADLRRLRDGGVADRPAAARRVADVRDRRRRPTGVELAGQIGELAHHALRDNFRNIDPAQAKILLFDAGERSCRLSASASRAKRRRRSSASDRDSRAHGGHLTRRRDDHGARRRRRAAHDRSDDDGLGGRRARGSLAQLIAEATGAPTDRLGRVSVLGDCSLPSHPESSSSAT